MDTKGQVAYWLVLDCLADSVARLSPGHGDEYDDAKRDAFAVVRDMHVRLGAMHSEDTCHRRILVGVAEALLRIVDKAGKDAVRRAGRYFRTGEK